MLRLNNFWFTLLLAVLIILTSCVLTQRPKNNGDIYVIKEISLRQHQDSTQTTQEDVETTTADPNLIDSEAIMHLCNQSFSMTMRAVEQFNTTGELPDLVDKTGMCYVRCYYEQSGLIDGNWKLNVEKIRRNIWPATGDSIEYCQRQGKNEENPCIRLYAIASCLMIRAIVDGKNQQAL